MSFRQIGDRSPGARRLLLERRMLPMILGVASAVLMLVGAFMPWVNAGIISAPGTRGDGAFAAIGAVVACAMFVLWGRQAVRGVEWPLAVAFLVGLVALGLVFYDAYHITVLSHSAQSALDELKDNPFAGLANSFKPSPGAGLYVTGAGSAAAALTAAFGTAKA